LCAILTQAGDANTLLALYKTDNLLAQPVRIP